MKLTVTEHSFCSEGAVLKCSFLLEKKDSFVSCEMG